MFISCRALQKVNCLFKPFKIPSDSFCDSGVANDDSAFDVSLLRGFCEICRRDKSDFAIDDEAFGVEAGAG
jgi:hypothetical protein